MQKPLVRSIALGFTPCVLAVDDDEMNLTLIEQILGAKYKVVKAADGASALTYLAVHTADIVLLDYLMPEMDGMEVLARIRANPATEQLPVVMLTGDMAAEREAEGFSAGVTDFVHKPFIPDVLRMRVERLLRYEYMQQRLLNEVNHQSDLAEERLAASERLFDELVLALAKAVDVKDCYTRGHSERVAQYAREIARRAGDKGEALDSIYSVSLLHDIGKIGIPRAIINKTSRLTDEEYTTIKSHTTLGASILNMVKEFPELSVGARSHHERWDGHGYPDGDAYDAMTSRRSYRDALPQEVARSEIVKGRGSQFDPEFADIMLQMIDEDLAFTMRDVNS